MLWEYVRTHRKLIARSTAALYPESIEYVWRVDDEGVITVSWEIPGTAIAHVTRCEKVIHMWRGLLDFGAQTHFLIQLDRLYCTGDCHHSARHTVYHWGLRLWFPMLREELMDRVPWQIVKRQFQQKLPRDLVNLVAEMLFKEHPDPRFTVKVIKDI